MHHINHVSSGGDDFGIGGAGRVLQTPNQIAVKVGGDQMSPAFGAVAGQIHPLPIGDDGAGFAMIAQPKIFGARLPGRAPTITGVAAKIELHRRMRDGLPTVIARRHRLARRPISRVGQAVPLHRDRPGLAAVLGQQMAHDFAIFVHQIERNLAREWHRKIDWLETCHSNRLTKPVQSTVGTPFFIVTGKGARVG